MQLFYTSKIAEHNTLSPQESHHAVKVLRLTEGKQIHIIDGAGGFYQASIMNPNSKACTVRIEKTVSEFEKRPYYLHMAVAPTKNIDRFEWFLEKATEIGIDEITPLICHHSERKVIKQERLERILISAAKQSIKAYLPKLNALTSFTDFISGINQASSLYIAHCYNSHKITLKEALLNSSQNITLLVGPEGDFSVEEVDLAMENNITPISLGESRLRTETAGVAACHSVYYNYL